MRDGQRRRLAASDAKLETMPVYVLEAPVGVDRVAAAERITHQIVANDQRTALTDA